MAYSEDPRTHLILPGEALEKMQKAVLDARASDRAKWATEYGRKSLRQLTGLDVKDEPMRGDLMSYGATYQPWNRVGGYRKPGDSVPFPFLREVSKKSVIDRAIIDTRIEQVRRYASVLDAPGRKLGFKVVHYLHEDPNFKQDESVDKRIEEATRRLSSLHTDVWGHANFSQFLSMWVEEELVLDRICLVVARDEDGRPVRYHMVDGANIKPRIEILAPWMFSNRVTSEPLAAEIVSNDPRLNPNKVDLVNAAYVQEIDGRFTAAWTADQMTIIVTNPSNRYNTFGYGFSKLEKGLEATTAFILAWNFNRELFKTNFPEAILALQGDYDDEGLEAFKRQMYGDGGPQSWWRMPVIAGGGIDSSNAEVLKLRDTPQEMMFGEMLRFMVVMKTAFYRMSPVELGFSSDSGGQQQMFGEVDTEKEISMATEQGLHTLLNGIAESLTNTIVKQCWDDLRVVVEGIERETKTQEIENDVAEVTSISTLDEVRAKRNRPPLPNKLGQVVLNPVYLQWVEMQMAAEQQTQQAEQYDQGDFGSQDQQEEAEGEPQDTGMAPASQQQWTAQPGGAVKPPAANVVKTKDKRPVGRAPAHPANAPFANEKARAAGPVKKSLTISFLEDPE